MASFVPQEALNINDGFVLPTHVANSVAKFFSMMNILVETPPNDHSLSLYTSLVLERYSIAQYNFIIGKLSSFILKKQYKYFPAIINIPDKINKALLKHVPPSTNLHFESPLPLFPLKQHLGNNPFLLMSYELYIHMFASTLSHAQPIKSLLKF